MGLLQNQVALVTGGGSGIGRSVAITYAREGARVVVSDIDQAGGQQTVSLVTGAGGEALFVKADVSVPENNEVLVWSAIEKYGALNIACNSAGIGGTVAPTGMYPIEAWEKVIAVNLSGVFYGMRYQIPAMLQCGGGVIVNMASILGCVGFANSPAYTAAKHGLLGLTKNAALEYGAKGIRVNAVGPAFIKTPLLRELDETTLGLLAARHPMARIGEPEEVAELVAWISSPKASFVTGAYYAVDGGYLAQ